MAISISGVTHVHETTCTIACVCMSIPAAFIGPEPKTLRVRAQGSKP